METDYLNPLINIDYLKLIIYQGQPIFIALLSRYFFIRLLENKAGKITLNASLVSLKEIIGSCLNIRSDELLIRCGYIFGHIWRKDYVYLFDSHSKDYEGNISQNGSAILMKFQTLDDLKDYIKLIYQSRQHH